ncbi:MAG TPA: hypothetical protein VF064_02860 [Pyrinomonadaceae bacterium]
MKALLTVLLLASVGVAADAQSAPPPDPPDLVVVKHSWSKERLNWEGDPFSGPNENFDQLRVRMRNEKRIMDAKSGGNQVELNKVEREARADSANIERIRAQTPARYGFLYKTSFRNAGGKTIKQIDWDYLFIDAATNQIVGRIELGADEKVEPGKKKDFSFFLPTPPAQTISVHALNSKERAGLVEQVVLVRVVYADGTIWQRP